MSWNPGVELLHFVPYAEQFCGSMFLAPGLYVWVVPDSSCGLRLSQAAESWHWAANEGGRESVLELLPEVPRWTFVSSAIDVC